MNDASAGVFRRKADRPKPQFPADQQGKTGGERYQPESADLDEAQNDHLAEFVPVRPGIVQHKARYTDRRR